MSEPEIVSIGGVAIDVIMRLPQLPTPGCCIRAEAMYHGLGGKAANQAVAAARLGGTVALIGAVGADDAGELALARVAAEGVSARWIRRVPGVATGTVMLQRDAAGNRQVGVFPGANARLDREAIDAAAAVICAARVVILQFEIPLDTVLHAMAVARSGGVPIILDPSPARQLPPEVLRGATVLRTNAHEASVLTGIDVHDLESARAAARQLLDLGIPLVAIEAGASGNLFCSREDEIFVPLYEVASIDPTGAGDALIGALAVAMVEGRTRRASAEFASAAAALSTRAFGAQTGMPRREEVVALVAAHSGDRVTVV